MGGARKWPENEAIAMKSWGVLVVRFRKPPMHRFYTASDQNWSRERPGNEATTCLAYLFCCNTAARVRGGSGGYVGGVLVCAIQRFSGTNML